MLKICGNCGFAKKAELHESTPTTHECRINPPRLWEGIAAGFWPRVCSSDWCGQWKAER